MGLVLRGSSSLPFAFAVHNNTHPLPWIHLNLTRSKPSRRPSTPSTLNQGYITADTVATILRMMGVKISEKNLAEVIAETDEDGSGQLEFEEFVELSSKFLIEEDEEALKAELREAFRI